jgi:stalled ribosome rescue protein Dom34
MSSHTLVWLDQQEARLIEINPEGFDETTIHAAARHVHRHPKGGAEASEHPADAHHYFTAVAKALADSREVLVVGPGTAKLHFLKHVHAHDRSLEPRIVGVETVDHPTDKQLVAYARHYFLAADRMR